MAGFFSEQKCPLATLVSKFTILGAAPPHPWEVNQGELYNVAIYGRFHPLISAVLLSLLAVVHDQF